MRSSLKPSNASISADSLDTVVTTITKMSQSKGTKRGAAGPRMMSRTIRILEEETNEDEDAEYRRKEVEGFNI